MDELFVARDEDESLFLYQSEPRKCGEQWVSFKGDIMQLDKKLFPSVRWTDKKPTKVHLIKN